MSIYKDNKREGKALGFEFNSINDLIDKGQYTLFNEGSLSELNGNFSKLIVSLKKDFPIIFEQKKYDK